MLWRASTASMLSEPAPGAVTIRCASGSIRRRSPRRNLTAGEVLAALRGHQNVRGGPACFNQPPVPTARAFLDQCPKRSAG